MVRRQQQADRALRPAMRSPGRPMPARHVERAFWRLIAQGKGMSDLAQVAVPKRIVLDATVVTADNVEEYLPLGFES